MPQIVELKEINGQVWARIEYTTPDHMGAITLWSDPEIKDYRNACVRDFLIELYNQWKDRI